MISINNKLNTKGLKLGLAVTAAAFGIFLTGTTGASASTTVKVNQGDTVSKIASQYKVSNEQIGKANNLKDINKIFVGEKLVIPTETQISQGTQQSQPVKSVQPVSQPATTTTQLPSTKYKYTSTFSNGNSAKAWIANRESGGRYGARNGQYIGKYQLSASYLHGDYSAANQERTANNYVNSRYGSWNNAKKHWMQKGWY